MDVVETKFFGRRRGLDVEEIRVMSLKGTQCLTIETTIKEYSDRTKSDTLLNTRVIKKEIFFTQVSAEEVTETREKGIAAMVLKDGSKYYLAMVPRKMAYNFKSFYGYHLCGGSGAVCARLIASSNENGGCEKVMNYSKGIERYPWIVSGYEVFNTRGDCLVVGSCLRHRVDNRTIQSVSIL